MNLIETFLGLFKSNGYQESEFQAFHKAATNEETLLLSYRSRLFFEIVKPIYKLYQEQLAQSGMIDFNDMINEATKIVKSGEIVLPYKYIIIDEYQDISMSRFRLTKTIMEQTGSKLMCVGDDWQSIYRFTGSDLDLFTSFGKYFGYFELLKIEKTYRNSQKLIDLAGTFIMRNEKQYRKDLVSDKNLEDPVRFLFHQNSEGDAVLRAIGEIVNEYGDKAEVLLLGRNNKDIEILKQHEQFNVKFDGRGKVSVSCKSHPNCNLSFLTVHRSKGLEADNVIILNVKNHLVGFPNQIADDPVLHYVLTNADPFPFAEERRVFYVALTRTRNRTYIIASDSSVSCFAEELEADVSAESEFVGEGSSVRDNPPCPKCKKGYLMVRENSQTKQSFLSCSYFPQCDYKVNSLEVLENQVMCPDCGGYMVLRRSQNDPDNSFYGCTNFPHCKKDPSNSGFRRREKNYRNIQV